MTSQNRFDVSEQGLRDLNVGREPWDLIKEFIQNTWDEAPFASECRVEIHPSADQEETVVTVEDNGPGFANIEDAYTMMGNTQKRSEPTKRGRFNRGEKDAISVSQEAIIETVGHTVTFPREGGRREEANDRGRGTLITAKMPWGEAERIRTVTKLKTLRPPASCHTTVNGTPVTAKPAEAVRRAQLETVIQENGNGPMKKTKRNTRIEITDQHDPERKSRIYEMGIPVEEILCPWDVDVMQKIPLDEKRDNVGKTYMNRIYAEVLNEVHYMTEAREFGSEWVKRAIEHQEISREAVRATLKGRYEAERAVFSTMDYDANQRAQRAGYAVIDRGGLSGPEVKAFRNHAGVVDSDIAFPSPKPPSKDYEADLGTPQHEFAQWATEISRQCGVNAEVRFFKEPESERLADCQASTRNPTMRFNEGKLSLEFFEEPYGRREQYNLLIHELGHALTDGTSLGHDEKWGEGVAQAGAIIAALRGERS